VAGMFRFGNCNPDIAAFPCILHKFHLNMPGSNSRFRMVGETTESGLVLVESILESLHGS
jgi:hypothetical protein